jgi:ATP-dependent Zn protease
MFSNFLSPLQSKIKHDNSVDVDKLAKMTVGFSGADLENMVNTAAIRAAVEGSSVLNLKLGIKFLVLLR